jgi:hypothetical protein
MQQPDFTKIFFNLFESQTGKLAYSLRDGANLPHDVQFLSSLIHDATFKISNITKTEQSVTININRDCWEHGRQEDTDQLKVSESILKFSRVKSIRWIIGDITLSNRSIGNVGLEDRECINKDTEYQIDRFFIGESTYFDGAVELVLTGYPYQWQLRILMHFERWAIELKDISLPALTHHSSGTA